MMPIIREPSPIEELSEVDEETVCSFPSTQVSPRPPPPTIRCRPTRSYPMSRSPLPPPTGILLVLHHRDERVLVNTDWYSSYELRNVHCAYEAGYRQPHSEIRVYCVPPVRCSPGSVDDRQIYVKTSIEVVEGIYNTKIIRDIRVTPEAWTRLDLVRRSPLEVEIRTRSKWKRLISAFR